MDLKYYKQYCANIENVENFEKAFTDNFIGWCCHHRLQTWTSDGERREVNISAAELKALNMYYNRPASELIFLTESEHSILHNKGEKHPMYGKKHSEETKKKMSENHKGMLGKKHSEESLRKMSDAQKGKHHTEEAKKKISEAKKGNTNTKGMHWYHNDTGNIMAKECPPGCGPGRLKK